MSDYGLNLGSNKNKKKNKRAVLIIAFLCFALILGSVSFLLLWKSLNFDFNNIFGMSEKNTEAEITASGSVREYEGVYVFASAVTDDEAKNLLFSQLISVNLKEKTVRVVPIDTATVLKDGKTVGETLISDGAASFKNAMEGLCGERVSRYFISTESDYKAVFREMGDITVTVSEDITFDTADMFLELSKGENTLTPEKTYKYMKYLCTRLPSQKAASGCADITVAAFKAFYTAENLRYADSLFEELINYCKTDASIVDFIEASDEINYIAPTSSSDEIKAFVSKSVRETAYEE